jgi:hypothetical protein
MGIFDSLGSLFGGGSSASAGATGYGASSGIPWLQGLAMLAQSFKATPRPGASQKDMDKANKINMLTGLLGAGAGMYAQRQDAEAKQTALQGLFDIYKNQGMNQNMQGPTMPGEMPLDAGLGQRIFAWGQQNPGLSDQAMKLGLDAMNQDVANQRYAQEQAFRQQQADLNANQWQQSFDAQRAYQNASLGLQRAQLGASQQNQMMRLQQAQEQAKAKAQQEITANILKQTEGADPAIRAKLAMGQVTEPNPDYIPNAPMVPGVTAPEILRGEVPQQINLFDKALNEASEVQQFNKERPLIQDSLQRLQTTDQNAGYTKIMGKFDPVIKMLNSNNYTQQMNALKSLTQMIDNSVVQAGEFTVAQQALIDNASNYARNMESWLGKEKKPLPPNQINTLKEIASIYASGAQNALKDRVVAEQNQLDSFGVKKPITLFDKYFEKSFSTPNANIRGLTPGTKLPNGYEYLGD